MELDELKKSWQMLDKKLESAPVTDTDRLAELMTDNRLGANQGLRRLIRVHQWSLYGGGTVILLLLVVGYIHARKLADFPALRTHLMLDFFALGGAMAILCDHYTYRFLRAIRIAEMTVVEVSRRMARYRRFVYYELWALAIWALMFNTLSYWSYGWYTLPCKVQIFLVGIILLLDVLLIGGFYHKMIFRPLKQTERHLKQMEGLCTK